MVERRCFAVGHRHQVELPLEFLDGQRFRAREGNVFHHVEHQGDGALVGKQQRHGADLVREALLERKAVVGKQPVEDAERELRASLVVRDKVLLVGAQIFQRYLVLAGQGVAQVHGGNDVLRGELHGFHVGQVGHVGAERHVEGALAQAGERFLRVGNRDVEFHRRIVGLAEGVQKLGQLVALHRFGGGDAHGALVLGAVGHGGYGPVHLGQGHGDVAVELLAVFGKVHAVLAALEQRYAQLLFQAGNGSGKRRLRDEQLFCGTVEVAHLGKLPEVIQL